ncbi:MAG: helix-turn-helix domain-containing protein, partial [Saprospiraceae bacterium]
PERRILWVNEDFTYITGYSLSEVLGKKPSILQGPKSEREVVRRIRKGLESQIPIKDVITNYRKNGEEYPCKLVIHPIFNENRKLTNFIAFEVDGNVVDSEDDIPLMQINEKYSSSSLKGIEEVKLYYQLKILMETEKLYLDPNLTLKQVADRLSTNTKYLSQVVNHHIGTNFQNFLNGFRVTEAKEKILQEEFNNLTLFGIALQCGFKNKSTFYKVFKEITGITPREYIKHTRKQVLIED